MARALIVALLALTAAACVRESDPFELDTDRLSVHVVLLEGSDSVAARITRAGDVLTGTPVADATVRLTRGSETTVLAFDPDRPCAESWHPMSSAGGCYLAALPSPVAAGEVYDLEIVLADGARITGRTAVPFPADILDPGAGDVVVAECNGQDTCYGTSIDQPPYVQPLAELTVRWTGHAASDRMLLAVRSTRVFLDGAAYPGETCRLGSTFARRTVAEGDSATWPITGISCGEPLSPARFDSIHAEVVLATTSGEYQRYLESISEGQTVRAASVSEGLDGAWGVFGAVAPARRPFTILRGQGTR